MLNLKKIAITMAVFVGGSAFAGTMGPVCMPGNVTVPCADAGWSLGVQALYLRPVYDSARTYVSSAGTLREMNDKWGWGFELDGAYHFRTGNDLGFTWMHYDVDSNAGNFVGAVPLFGTTTYAMKHANKFDQVNMVFGQHVDFGLLKNARFYGGLQYVNIRSEQSRAYQLTPAAALADLTGISARNDADFYGVGPVIGIDYSYDLSSGFSINANTAMSILAGPGRNETGFAFAPTGLVPTTTYLITKAIVPGVEAKLGLNYAYIMSEGVLNLSGGYQVVNYFGALPLINAGGPVTSSDFGLYGPYLGLSWLGNV